MSDNKLKNIESSAVEQIKLRENKLKNLRKLNLAYPNKEIVKLNNLKVKESCKNLSNKDLETNQHIFKVGGRIIAKRSAFIVIRDVSGDLQLYIPRKELNKEHLLDIENWDIGDIVWVKGEAKLSKKGDLFICIRESKLLTKSLRPLPSNYYGIKDTETKYRQRYLDLIINLDSRNIFKQKSKIINTMRNFLNEKEYIEVETPMMHKIPGGALAKPFITHHNALDMELFLRVSPELYLKYLVIGGLEKCYEINRSFRNEGISTKHNPEFTMMECYCAYSDYKYMIDLVENMIKYIANNVCSKEKIKELKLDQKFKIISLQDSIILKLQDDNFIIKKDLINDYETLCNIAKKYNIKVEKNWNWGKLQVEIFEKLVEHNLHNPTFIINYPIEVSPLSRRNDYNQAFADRFELFINGWEIANGFSELNDPDDQEVRFLKQVKAKAGGDDEAMYFDKNYIEALRYGLPPTSGLGLGIDRLSMLLLGLNTIKDVILFPLLKDDIK